MGAPETATPGSADPETALSPAGRRERRRLQHQNLNREQLLDAAEVVFGSKGFAKATLKEIAELAGFAVGSVYSFFPSKEELFRQVVDRRGRQFMARMEAVARAGRARAGTAARAHRSAGRPLPRASRLQPALRQPGEQFRCQRVAARRGGVRAVRAGDGAAGGPDRRGAAGRFAAGRGSGGAGAHLQRHRLRLPVAGSADRLRRPRGRRTPHGGRAARHHRARAEPR